jgi:asparaginyl-tRNA synthetase
MQKRIKIKQILSGEPSENQVIAMGWVRSFRNNQFLAINDGSTINNLQVVINNEITDDATLKRLSTGACVKATGVIVASLGKGQTVEMQATEIEILGDSDAELFPLQPKKHSLDFLRSIAHLRPRTNTFSAIFRIRHTLAFAVHQFFHDRGFAYWHSPIITGSDAEGAGEMFRVSTFEPNAAPINDHNEVDYSQDFFGKQVNLTVSGQLEGELGAMGLGEIYTFGPTFRAENSNTTRHLAEFWMIEPEMAFYDLDDNMQLAQDLLQHCISAVINANNDDLQFLQTRLEDEEKQKPANERSPLGLIEKLKFVIENEFERVTYTQAIEILKNSKPNKEKKFNYLINEWGVDLQSEHERYLVEKHFKKPVILTDYPKDIKAFYMRQNDDEKTVRAMDILFPGIGEIIGGSQREERLDKLTQRMNEMNISTEELSWYLDTRRFGTCPHAGFGLGFERLVLFVTGMTNIRDVIPFPRFPKNAAF